MKTAFFSLVFAAASMLSVSSCKNKNVTEPTPPNFNPTTANSTWTYRNESNGTNTVTATNRDTTINSKSYRVYTNSAGGFQYMARQGNNYYRFGNIPAINAIGVEELYLKDNENVEGTWSDVKQVLAPGIPTPLNATLGYKIKSKGGTRTVNNKVFNNVTYVRLDISVAQLGFNVPIGGGDFYYADGIGLIENSLIINAPGQPTVNTSQVLISYNIK
jgi:hypothetical protein